jgi:hypothetical protein
MATKTGKGPGHAKQARRMRTRLLLSVGLLVALVAAALVLSVQPWASLPEAPASEDPAPSADPAPAEDPATAEDPAPDEQPAPREDSPPDGSAAAPILPALVIVVAAIGGLSQELLQSGGAIVLPRKDQGGVLYLGSLLGVVSGAAGGFLLLTSVDAAGLGLAFAAGFGAKSSIETLPRVKSLRRTASDAVADPVPA